MREADAIALCALLQQAALDSGAADPPKVATTMLAGTLHLLRAAATKAMLSRQYDAVINGAHAAVCPQPCARVSGCLCTPCCV